MSPPSPSGVPAPKKRGLFSRKPSPAPTSAPQISPPISSWPTSPSPPLPSDSQGVFPAHRNSAVGHVDWNSVGDHMTGGSSSASPSLSASARVSEDGRKLSDGGGGHSRSQSLGRSSSGKSDGEGKSGGVRSFFGRNKRSTMPAQQKGESGAGGGQSGIPVPVQRNNMPRSQSSGVLAGSGRELESPSSQTSPSFNVTPASPTHPRIRAHHKQQAALQAGRPNGSIKSPLSPGSTPLPYSPTSSSFNNRPLGTEDANSLRSNNTSRSGADPALFSPGLQSIAPPFSPPLPRGPSNPSANRSAGNMLPGSTSVAAPFRIRVFIDHPTTEPLYITVIPGEETLRTLKHKILKVDNERFVQFRQARRPPVETRWDIHPSPADERVEGDKTYDVERRIQLFRVSVDWLVVSKTKRNYEKTRTFVSILSSSPSTPILPPSEDDVLPLLQLFPATEASAAARLKGLIEIVVRVTPEKESVPVLVSFSDMPDQPVVVDVEHGATVLDVKESIAKARGLAVRVVGGRTAALEAHDFFLFKCTQPRHTTEPLPYDIDQFEGLAPESLFDDEAMAFAAQPLVIESGLHQPENLLRTVELVAFLSSDMEDEFRDSLIMKSNVVENETDEEIDNGLTPAANIINKARGVTPPQHIQGHPSRPDNVSRQDSRSSAISSSSSSRNVGPNGQHHRSSDSPSASQRQQQHQREHEQARREHHEREQARQHHHRQQEQARLHQQQEQARYQQHQQQQQQYQRQQQERQQQERDAREQAQRQQQQQQQPPYSPTYQNGAPRSNGNGSSASSTPPRSSPPRVPHPTMSSDQMSVASPSSYRTARNGETGSYDAGGMISPRLVSNLSSHQRSAELDPLEHAPTDSGLDDVLRNYTSDGSAGSLRLSEAGGIEGLKNMLEKVRVASVDEEDEQEEEAEGDEEMTFGDPVDRDEARDAVGQLWSKSPGGVSLSTLGEEEEEIPAPPHGKGDFHSRTSSNSSGTSPLLLVHIRKPYAGPMTDATSFVEDISPTSHSVPLPPVSAPSTFASSTPSPRSSTASMSSATSESSFSAGPASSRADSNASSVYSRPSYDQQAVDPTDRTGGSSSPMGSERTVVPNGNKNRNDSVNSVTSSTTSEKTATGLPSPVEQRFRFASMGSLAKKEPPAKLASPTKPTYALAIAVPRRGSRRDSSSYGAKSTSTGYPLPLRSALKGAKAEARAKAPAASSTRRVPKAGAANRAANRNSYLGGAGNRNSYLGGASGSGNGSNRNSLLLNSRFIPNVGRGGLKSPASPGGGGGRTKQPRFQHQQQAQHQQNYSSSSSNASDAYSTDDSSASAGPSAGTVDLTSSLPPTRNGSGSGSSGGRENGWGCAEGYAVVGGAMFRVSLRPMDEKGAQVMQTSQFKKAGPMYKLEAY